MDPRNQALMKHPAVPYVAPFAAFLLLLVAAPYWPWDPRLEQYFRVVVLTAVIWFFSRQVIDFRCAAPLQSIAVGVGVWLLWIAPDTLFPGYRQHWLFTNSLTGQVSSSIQAEALGSAGVLVFRTLRAAILVPILEELFWRGWLMRWLINPDFLKVPLGAYSLSAVLIAGALFASEHGPFWEVGLAAGLIYNLW
ncbi:MAG: CAAX prenyl protease-related protein, partial [Acidobacteriia bacterium 12-62-4]